LIATPAGRYLGATAGLLALGFVLWALNILPRSYATLALLLAGTLGIAALLVFFRDPERVPKGDVVSAADGKVRAVDRDATALRISVFMNVTDVHVNRFPLAGTVTTVEDGGEGFRPAFHPDAVHNVWRKTTVATSAGEVEVVQMTGVVARRIIPFVAVGDERAKGDRLGMIVLGSRVDVLFDRARARPTVKVGDRVVAGVTRIARETDP
jgi:phosphatidylserine decarboxylase